MKSENINSTLEQQIADSLRRLAMLDREESAIRMSLTNQPYPTTVSGVAEMLAPRLRLKNLLLQIAAEARRVDQLRSLLL